MARSSRDEVRSLGLAVKRVITLNAFVILICREGLHSLYP